MKNPLVGERVPRHLVVAMCDRIAISPTAGHLGLSVPGRRAPRGLLPGPLLMLEVCYWPSCLTSTLLEAVGGQIVPLCRFLNAIHEGGGPLGPDHAAESPKDEEGACSSLVYPNCPSCGLAKMHRRRADTRPSSAAAALTNIASRRREAEQA
jgi:hypothetical protein